MITSDSGDVRGRLLDAATRLFSHLGYDAVTVQMIADSAGLDAAAVTELVGGRRELYIAVMERITEAEYAFLKGRAAGLAPGLAGMIRLADAYLDFCVEHPELPALWMHRWLDDAADITELEDRFSGVIQSMLLEEVRKAVGGGEVYGGELPFDLEVTAWSIVWCVHGFVQSGFVDERGRTRDAQDPRALRRVRAYLHRLIGRMTQA